MHAVAHDYDAIKGESGLRAVLGDKLVDGVLVKRGAKLTVSCALVKSFA